MNNLSLKPNVKEALDKSISFRLDSLTGTNQKISDISREVLADICTQFSNNQLLETLPGFIQKLVQSAVNQRSLERESSDQSDLFSDSYAERLIKHGPDYVCKTADATWPILVDQQRRRRENLMKQARSFEREEKRMDALMDAGMAANPEMTVRDAMAVMRES